MNSRDLLYSIAETNEDYLRESERFDVIGAAVKAERRKQRAGLTAAGIAFVLGITVFFVLKHSPHMPEVHIPNDTTGIAPETTDPPTVWNENSTSAAFTTDNQPSGEGNTVPGTDLMQQSLQNEQTSVSAPAGDRTAHSSAPSDAPMPQEPESSRSAETTQTSTTADQTDPTTEAPAEPPTEQPSTDAGTPGTAHGVLTTVTVDYNTAKSKFGHPILPCTHSDFVCYKAGIVSRNGDTGDPGAYCLSVTYVFMNGTVSLTDQDRLPGNSYNPGNRTYRGRSFYVYRYDGNGVYEDRVQVGYFPAGTNGIAYQADFAVTADVEEIMDLILSLEI